jgi:hypothetical protein
MNTMDERCYNLIFTSIYNATTARTSIKGPCKTHSLSAQQVLRVLRMRKELGPQPLCSAMLNNHDSTMIHEIKFFIP